MASLWNLNYHYVMSSGGERSTYLYSKMCCAGEWRGGVLSAGLWCFQCGGETAIPEVSDTALSSCNFDAI